MSLANALAASTAAKNLVLLGDPLQLAQVSQGSHPDGCELSVLEHLLGDAATIPPERGIFLERSWRMHPDVCRFNSDVVYESRLESEAHCALRRVDAQAITGTGLRCHPIEHEGNSQESKEEADWIAHAVAAMLSGGHFTDWDQPTRPLQPRDLVVTPYNAQVSKIRETFQKHGLPVPVGTVDKFQGQEAPIVFFSMATSSGTDIPRSLDFLFSRNRLNVAIFRAQCLAILVASPRLLDVECRTVEQMRLVNSLCRITELATKV
jgi:superfamily I DNA and/or RNA helicase